MMSMKKMILVMMCCFVTTMMAAQKYVKYEPVNLRTDNPDGVYALGDTVRIIAEIGESADSELLLDVEVNGKISERRIVPIQKGESIIIEKVFDSPTHMIVGLGPAPKWSCSTRIGVIAGPEGFKPGYAEPSDFRSYWDTQISKMREFPAEPVVTPVTSDGDVRCFSIEIPMHEGFPVRGYVALPADAAPSSLPIYLKAHAAGTLLSAHTRSSVKEVTSMARNGAIAIDINAHGMLNDAPKEYYQELESREILMYQDRPVSDKESYYFRLMYLRLVRALDYVCSMPEWDGKRVLLTGESQGGGQALVLAGLDSRVDAVVAIVPALTDLGGAVDGLRMSGWPYNRRPMVSLSSRGREVLPYFDAALHLKYYKGSLYVEAGLIDVTCNPACISAGYNNCSSSDKEILYYPYRPHNSMSEVYKKEWTEMVLSRRIEFINEYLK